jgi:DNA-binding protein HU-beta
MTTEKTALNKIDFVRFIAKNQECTQVEAEKYVNIFTESLISAFKDGLGVELVGFGSFNIQHVNAREGRNPKTGEKMNISAYNKPSFRAGKKLKEACND